jgi:predicted NBD/HSP70 family sugar kinase
MAPRATVTDLRQRNRAAVLRDIVFSAETTRATIAANCRLSAATVSNVVSDLIRESLVEENGSVPSDGGRPIARIRLAPEGGYFLGADVGEHGVTVELFDLSLHRVDRVFRALPADETSASRIANALREAVLSIRSANPGPAAALIGIGLGLPGIVDVSADGATTIYAQSLGWKPTRVDEVFGESNTPIFADNGAKTSALAEMWLGAVRGVDHAVVALVGRGIGAGVISGGRLMRGLSSSAGEWGHTKVSLDGPVCRCGARGCLEAYVGGSAMVRRWRDTGVAIDGADEEGLSKLVEAALSGDEAATQVLDDTIEILGIGLANLVNLFNPDKIVVGGWAGLRLLEARGDRLEARVRNHALERPGQQFRLEACRFGDNAVALGAALLPLEQLIEGTLRPQRAAHLVVELGLQGHRRPV